MTDDEAYRYGKQIADQWVRSGRAIRLGSGGESRRPTAGGTSGYGWLGLAIIVGLIVLFVWLLN